MEVRLHSNCTSKLCHPTVYQLLVLTAHMPCGLQCSWDHIPLCGLDFIGLCNYTAIHLALLLLAAAMLTLTSATGSVLLANMT